MKDRMVEHINLFSHILIFMEICVFVITKCWENDKSTNPFCWGSRAREYPCSSDDNKRIFIMLIPFGSQCKNITLFMFAFK
jgi:hypothetical protein